MPALQLAQPLLFRADSPVQAHAAIRLSPEVGETAANP
jgi:hypothetical protein